MNQVNAVGVQLKPSWVDKIRANRAQKAIDARQASFQMNEFGDVGIVDYGTLKKVGNLDYKDVSNVLQGREVKVRTPEIRQCDPKPHQIKLSGWGAFCASVANFFKARTTGRANRLQNEMELQFGRVAGCMVNMAIYHAEGDHHLANEVKARTANEIATFVRQVEDFVRLYSLDVTQQAPVEEMIQKLVDRFANSIKEDQTAVHQLYTMAKQWPIQGGETRGDAVLLALQRALAPFVTQAPAVEEAEPVEVQHAAQPQRPQLAEQREQERAALKVDLKNQVKMMRELCETVGAEMDVFKDAIRDVWHNLEGLDDVKHLSGSNFRTIIAKMDSMLQEVISKGKMIIEETLDKKCVEEVQLELQKEYGDISQINFEETNTCVSELLNTNWSTAEEVKARLDIGVKEISWEEALDSEPQWKKLKSSDAVSTINHVNRVIEEFADARTELNTLIVDRVERYELMALLETKAQTPPEGVDSKMWQETCQLVGDYLVHGGKETPEALRNEHVMLLKNHEDFFTQDLSTLAKTRLATLFNVFDVSVGFVNTSDVNALAAAGASFKACEEKTAGWVNQLIGQLQTLLMPNGDDPLAQKAAEILKKLLDARGFDLEQCIQTSVPETYVARQDGVFFTMNGERCYLENEALETLFACLRKAAVSTQGMLVNTLAAKLANVKGNYIEHRSAAMEHLKKVTEPFVTAQRTIREVLVGNALARIRDGMGYIRQSRPASCTKEDWANRCHHVERALSEVNGMDVACVRQTCQALLHDIRKEMVARSKAETPASTDGIAVLEKNFSADVATLVVYGEHGEVYGNNDLRSAINLMDQLKITSKRTMDLQDLIFNSLEILPKNVAKLEALQKTGTLRSKWMKINANALRTLADQLRADFAVYTKKVANYANLLREEGAGNVDSERRHVAVEEVKDALSICTASFMPLIRMVSELEIYAREAFLYYDVEVVKDKRAAEKAAKAQQATGTVAETPEQAPQVAKTPPKETPPLCTDLELAKTAKALHIAVQNAFCALSEIPRGLLLAQGKTAETDGLHLLKMEETHTALNLDTMRGVERKRMTERSSIPFIGHNVFTFRGIATASDEGRAVAKAREIYREGFDGDAFSMRMTMVRRGGRSADLFNATENAILSLAAEKRRGLLSPEVVAALEEIVDARVRIRDVETLHQRLQKKVPNIASKDLQLLDTNGEASDLVMKLMSLSSKWEAYSIQDQGTSTREYYAQQLDKLVKDYRVVSINDNQSKTDRVLLADAKGNKAFYTLKMEEKFLIGKRVVFTPEPGAASTFKPFDLAAKDFPLALPDGAN